MQRRARGVDVAAAQRNERAVQVQVGQRPTEEELIKQAKGATPMRLAQGAARAAVEQSFAMPLKAAGIDARVTARFAAD